MTIKRKTQLNLSGSHRNLDADFAHIGSTLFVTGSVIVTGSMSSSGDLSTQGILRVQGATQLTGAVNLASTLSASGQISTAGNLFAQGTTQLGGAVNLYSTLSASGQISTAAGLRVGAPSQLTGAVSLANGLSASQDITAGGIISGSTGRFTYLSGALSASSTGLPFLVAGSGVTTTFSHTDLNWTIAATGGGGGTVQGSDTQVQFNQNGAFAASSSLTHTSGTLGVHAISGSLTSSGTVFGNGFEYNGNILKINTNVLVTQSAMLFDGAGLEEIGGVGVALSNGATFNVFSGSSFGGPNDAAGRAFRLGASQVSGEVDVFSNGINIKAMTGSVTTGPIGFGGDTNILSSSLLTRAMQNNCVGKFNISVLGAATGSGDFISADIVAVASKSSAGVYGTFGVTEVTLDAIGTNALGWDVNINTNGDIAVTGSGGTVRWYGQVTKMMILSGSANGERIAVY